MCDPLRTLNRKPHCNVTVAMLSFPYLLWLAIGPLAVFLAQAMGHV